MPTKRMKNVAETASKQPRAKRKSDEIYNARRRARRAAAKLERQLERGNIENENVVRTQKYINQINEAVSQSYAIKSGKKRGQYAQPIERMISRFGAVSELVSSGIRELPTGERAVKREGLSQAEIMRREKVFERQISQASSGGISMLSKEEVKIFYAATKNLWEGQNIQKRNILIKRKLGVESLEEAWEKVFEDENVKRALEQAQQAQKRISSEADISDGSRDEREEKGSPQYIKGLILALDR